MLRIFTEKSKSEPVVGDPESPIGNMPLETSPSLSVYNTVCNGAGEGDPLHCKISDCEGRGEGSEESSSIFDGAIEAQPLHLAMGIGADVCWLPMTEIGDAVDAASGFQAMDAQGVGVAFEAEEEHYRRMVEENPSSPLFLKEYAQFLYQSKRDTEGAEACYSRALLLDARDGDTLAQYARLIWEQYHDQERASNYFQAAVHACPFNSDVLAAHARFLWEIDEPENE